MMHALIHLLHEEKCSLVVAQDIIRTFNGRGVSDLFHLLNEESEWLRWSRVADKIVGKGAAALMISGGVKEVYADVISQPALQLLHLEGILVAYGQLVPRIINREGTGQCPLEMRLAACRTAAECLPLIREFIEEMRLRRSQVSGLNRLSPN